jgi:hypothetical protein
MTLDQAGERDLVGVRARTSNLIGRGLLSVLKAQLNVIQAGLHQGFEAIRRESNPGRDQIDVKPRLAAGRNQLDEILAGQRSPPVK